MLAFMVDSGGLVATSDPLTIVVVAALAVVFLVIYFTISAARARKRSQAITRVAQEIGFSFEGDKWSDPEQGRNLKTALFKKGRALGFKNIMTGSSAELRASLFDYSFQVGAGRESHNYAQTVATFLKRGLVLSEFELEPAGIMQKIGDALVHKNIRFDSHPEFPQRYQLRSPDEEGTRELFTPALLSYLEGLDPKKKWRLEGTGETLILYRAGKRVDPGELRRFFDEAGALAGSFFSLVGARKSAS